MRLLMVLGSMLLAAFPAAAAAPHAPDCSIPSEIIEDDPRLPEFAEQLRQKHPITIVAIGGSSTAGMASGNAAEHAYPQRLQAALKRLYPDVPITVLNKGVSRQTTQEMVDRFSRDGVNDIGSPDSDGFKLYRAAQGWKPSVIFPLPSPGDYEDAVQDRHGRYFAAFGTDEALEALFTHGRMQRLHALRRELDNHVSACRRATTHREGRCYYVAMVVVLHARTIHIDEGNIGRGQTTSERLPCDFRIRAGTGARSGKLGFRTHVRQCRSQRATRRRSLRLRRLPRQAQ